MGSWPWAFHSIFLETQSDTVQKKTPRSKAKSHIAHMHHRTGICTVQAEPLKMSPI